MIILDYPSVLMRLLIRASRTGLPSGNSLKRDDATALRAPYAQRRYKPRRSLAITRVAACSEKPLMNADNGARRSVRGLSWTGSFRGGPAGGRLAVCRSTQADTNRVSARRYRR